MGQEQGWETDEYLYLAALGVSPSSQCQGKGSELMTRLCERADRERLPVMLETSGTRREAFYQRFGFRTAETVVLDEELMPETQYLMVRDPVLPAAAASASPVSSSDPAASS